MARTVLALAVLLLLGACRPGTGGDAMTIEDALGSVAADWVGREDIHAVYQSQDDQGRWIIKVIASGDSSAVASSLPAEVGGYRVVVEPGDPFEPLGG